MFSYEATPIHPITGRHSLSPSSFANHTVRLPYESLSCVQEHDRFTTFHRYTMHGLGSASPPVVLVSASGELLTPEPTTYLLVKLLSIFSLSSITTFISDLHVLAIPCFALAPNRLMLAVVMVPHGFITVHKDAATLSQAHLIQPGRALEAELQVRSSFRESLQLHL